MFRRLFIAELALISISILGCSGGSSSPASTATGLSGTASVGAPIAYANITLTDVNGKTITTTADSNGGYSISDVSSLTPPILVTASGAAGGRIVTYNSLITSIKSGNLNTANTNPLTDSIVYQASGSSPGTLISNPNSMANISSSSFATATSNATTAVTAVLNGISAGSSSAYNPTTTPYVADGSSAYDKIFDLLSIYPTANGGNYNINIADKSGTNGTVTLTSGQSSSSITSLPTLPASITSLKLSDLETAIKTFNNAAQVGISSATFSSLFSSSFLNDGFNKSQFITDLSTSTTQDYLTPGTTFKNPQIISCNTGGICTVQISVYNPTAVVPFPIQIPFIYDSGSGNWLIYGNQQPDLRNNATSFARLVTSSGNISVGFEFNVYGPIEASTSGNTYGGNPYNSATVTFQNAAGVIDYTIYFIQKPGLASTNSACDVSSSNYSGLPIANLANPSSNVNDNSTCSTITNGFSDETVLNTINSKILAGGYQLVTKAYTSNNWTGTPVIRNDILPPTPIAASNLLNKSYFPSALASTDSTGPYLAISNASPFVQNGHQCISSLNSCDYSNNPNYTYSLSGASNPAPTILRPTPAWPNGTAINSFSLHLQDPKNGWDIFVTN